MSMNRTYTPGSRKGMVMWEATPDGCLMKTFIWYAGKWVDTMCISVDKKETQIGLAFNAVFPNAVKVLGQQPTDHVIWNRYTTPRSKGNVHEQPENNLKLRPHIQQALRLLDEYKASLTTPKVAPVPAALADLAWLRENGWYVAVHNDYVLRGKRMTFWMFSRPAGRGLTGVFVKGEGTNDEHALAVCRAEAEQSVWGKDEA